MELEEQKPFYFNHYTLFDERGNSFTSFIKTIVNQKCSLELFFYFKGMCIQDTRLDILNVKGK